MVSNCRGNPAWLPILRAATSGRPYKFLFGSGYAGLGKRERDAIWEDLLASTSPQYLESIKEGKKDYKSKRVKTHKEVFGE
jgi:hypothetical protein